MLSGHLATALIANQRLQKSNLLFLLIASVLPDLLWILFHYLGLEHTTPSDIFSVSLQSMSVNMLWSHDLLPQIVWVLLVFTIGKMIFNDNKIALMGSLLVFVHFLCDLLSGYPHFVFDTNSPSIGLGLYKSNVYLAILIEFVFTTILLTCFFKKETSLGIKRTTQNMYLLIGLFAYGIIFFLFTATHSLRDWFGLPEINIPFNTTTVFLIITYVFMVFSVNAVGRKQN